MTLHSDCDHACERCGVFYIPYDNYIPCPICGVIENTRYDFISEAIDSLNLNKSLYRTYLPHYWAIITPGDYILLKLFKLFELYDYLYSPLDFLSVAWKLLNQENWQYEEYLQTHVLNISLRVYEEIDSMDIPKDGKPGDKFLPDIVLYSVGDIIDTGLNRPNFLRIECIEKYSYVVRDTYFDNYTNEFVIENNVYRIKANHPILKKSYKSANLPLSENDLSFLQLARCKPIYEIGHLREYAIEENEEFYESLPEEHPSGYIWTVDDQFYDYSKFDPNDLESDEIFNE